MIVYRHRRLDTNEIFYIGIGKTEKRAYSKKDRNSLWYNTVNKAGYSVEIISEVDTWELACELEQLLIQEYGRKDLGLGSLVNMTDGGEGFFNGKHSDETRLKMSFKKKDKPSKLKGSVISEEHRLKISESKKGCKPTVTQHILDTQTGVFYNSITECCFYYDIKRTTLNAMLKGQNPNKTNLIII